VGHKIFRSQVSQLSIKSLLSATLALALSAYLPLAHLNEALAFHAPSTHTHTHVCVCVCVRVCVCVCVTPLSSTQSSQRDSSPPAIAHASRPASSSPLHVVDSHREAVHRSAQ
jgi:hypothetical protein